DAQLHGRRAVAGADPAGPPGSLAARGARPAREPAGALGERAGPLAGALVPGVAVEAGAPHQRRLREQPVLLHDAAAEPRRGAEAARARQGAPAGPGLPPLEGRLRGADVDDR